jgi:hypothetical protein
MAIPLQHSPIEVDGIVYDLTHLTSFGAAIPGKGIAENTDLAIAIVFSNHVFTERTKHGKPHDILDQYGTRRTFDRTRYEMSKALGQALKDIIETNALTYVSRSFGGVDNLVFLRTEDGRIWTIVYCLQPVIGGQTVRMEVLSAHPKVIDQTKISRRNISYYARKCLFENSRIPHK